MTWIARALFAFAFLSLSALLLHSCPARASSMQVATLGDSLQISRDGDAPRWPELAYGAGVQNLGKGGWTCGDVAKWMHLPMFSPAYSAGKVAVQCGGNDATQGVTLELYEAELSTIVHTILANGAALEVVVVHSPPSWRGNASELRAAQRGIDLGICAGDERIRCSADLSWMVGREYFQADAVHLSALGHEAVARAVPEPGTWVLVVGLVAMGAGGRSGDE